MSRRRDDEQTIEDLKRAGESLADLVRAIVEVKGADWPYVSSESRERLEAWEQAKRGAFPARAEATHA